MSNSISKLTEVVAALEDALAAGVLTVVVDGETTTFDSERGLRNRIAYFNEKLNRLRGQQLDKPFKGGIAINSPAYARTATRGGGCGG